MEERESDIPEWAVPDEEIPPSLENKWREDEKKGVRAGVCKACGWPFTDQDLSCRHCGQRTEIPSGTFSDISDWLLKTPWGVITLITFILVLLSLLIRSF